MLLGIAHKTPNKLRTKCSGVLAVNKKVIYSLLILFSLATPVTIEKTCLLRLSTVRVLPFAVVYKKKAMQGEASTFQILF
jgi:hypothetical protein